MANATYQPITVLGTGSNYAGETFTFQYGNEAPITRQAADFKAAYKEAMGYDYGSQIQGPPALVGPMEQNQYVDPTDTTHKIVNGVDITAQGLANEQVQGIGYGQGWNFADTFQQSSIPYVGASGGSSGGASGGVSGGGSSSGGGVGGSLAEALNQLSQITPEQAALNAQAQSLGQTAAQLQAANQAALASLQASSAADAQAQVTSQMSTLATGKSSKAQTQYEAIDVSARMEEIAAKSKKNRKLPTGTQDTIKSGLLAKEALLAQPTLLGL